MTPRFLHKLSQFPSKSKAHLFSPSFSSHARTPYSQDHMLANSSAKPMQKIGNVWIFGDHTSSTESPNLYRLCIVFLVFSCIGYAMPFILCTTICCCLPCINSILGFREDLNQTRGATSELINALPTYKFKLKKSRNGDGAGAAEFGYVAMGTEKERATSEEDALCCICLAKYVNNDELRELPCSHLFHKECVDKWLKINALCPLCKTNVGDSVSNPLAGLTASLRHA
ncbi:E3 ubiquitin-protein ligase-like protein [Drosera capensis]